MPKNKQSKDDDINISEMKKVFDILTNMTQCIEDLKTKFIEGKIRSYQVLTADIEDIFESTKRRQLAVMEK